MLFEVKILANLEGKRQSLKKEHERDSNMLECSVS